MRFSSLGWGHSATAADRLENTGTVALRHRLTPLSKVPDSAIREAGLKFASGAQESFMSNFSNPPELKKKLKV